MGFWASNLLVSGLVTCRPWHEQEHAFGKVAFRASLTDSDALDNSSLTSRSNIGTAPQPQSSKS